ncbi:MAG: aquaporin [Actinobacteria bacterium]|nr:aquaporin [Actinomycetota bacterium]
MKEKLAAEFIGTFTLILIGAGAIMNGKADLLGIALAHGLAIAIMVSAFAAISGAHFNPAVSFGMLITKRLNTRTFLSYVAAQLSGASLAAVALRYIAGWGNDAGKSLGAASVANGISPTKAMVAEAIGTFLLVAVIFGVAVDKRGTFGAVAGFPIGLMITLDILFMGPLTGAAVNPARWFGPALVSGTWINSWVWIVGPLLGAGVAALLYDALFTPEKKSI